MTISMSLRMICYGYKDIISCPVYFRKIKREHNSGSNFVVNELKDIPKVIAELANIFDLFKINTDLYYQNPKYKMQKELRKKAGELQAILHAMLRVYLKVLKAIMVKTHSEICGCWDKCMN